LAQALCQSDTPITVAQVAIASVNGGGYLSAALGGVSATSSEVAGNQYNLSLPGLLSLGGSATDGGGSQLGVAPAGAVAGLSGSAVNPSLAAPAVPSAGAVPAVPASTQAAGPATTTAAPVVASPAAAAYSPGGPLLAIGLAGLGLLAVLAEADRRMMRRAQHTINFEEQS
jgi:hypothetical protein